MAVAAQIKAQLDRMAYGRQTMKAAFATGDDFWTKVDAAADETYENRVKGSDITALDTALANMSVFGTSALAKWFTLHNDYFNADLSLASPYIASYLATVGWRVPYEAAECLVDALGSSNRLSAWRVFPKGIRPADEGDPTSSGMHKFGQWTEVTYAVTDGALVNSYAPVLFIPLDATVNPSSPIATATLQDATTKDIAFSPSATQYAQGILGSQAIGAAGAAAAQKDIPVAATAQFKAGEWVLIVKADYSVQEVAQIDSLVANTSLTMESNLINSFVENDLVLPMFTNVTRKSGGFDADKDVAFYAFPDRIIAL